MKRKTLTNTIIAVCAALLAIFVVLVATHTICIFHEYSDADCIWPETCVYCGKTRGEELGHDFIPATCVAPATCRRCGETQGTTLEHSYGSPDASGVATCTYCGAVTQLSIQEAAEYQGIEIPENFIPTSECGQYGTFFPTDLLVSSMIWSAPDVNQSSGTINLPMDGYNYGLYNGKYVVRDTKGNIFYMDARGVGFQSADEGDTRPYAGLRKAIKNQGVTVPDDFSFGTAVSGKMYTKNASSHAVYKYKFPTPQDKTERYGIFYFRNEGLPDTYSDTGTVVLYGSYGSHSLFSSGTEFFWAIPMYFISN